MAEEKKSFMQQFMDFLNKYGVIGLAVAFVMGAACICSCGRPDNADNRGFDTRRGLEDCNSGYWRYQVHGG